MHTKYSSLLVIPGIDANYSDMPFLIMELFCSSI